MSHNKPPSHSIYVSINLLVESTQALESWNMTIHDIPQAISLVFSRPGMEPIAHIVTGYTDIHQLFQDIKAVLRTIGLSVAPSSIQVANRMVSTAFTVAVNRGKAQQSEKHD